MTNFPTVSHLTNLRNTSVNQQITSFIEAELPIIAEKLLNAAESGKNELCREYDAMKYNESHIQVLVFTLKDKKLKVSEPSRVTYAKITASQIIIDCQVFWRIYISGW